MISRKFGVAIMVVLVALVLEFVPLIGLLFSAIIIVVGLFLLTRPSPQESQVSAAIVQGKQRFLGKTRNRIIIVTLIGLAVQLVGGLVLYLIVFGLPGPTAMCGPYVCGQENYGPYVAGNIVGSIQFLIFFPPFLPALLPAALFARKGEEGAIAGFFGFLWVPVLFAVTGGYSGGPNYCNSGGSGCGLYGLGEIIYTFTPLLGAVVGAGGGAVGGWRQRRRIANPRPLPPVAPTTA